MSKGNDREQKSTKTKILEAAVEIFSETGFGVATMRDLAKAAGITAGSIYNYFESKESILLSLLDFYEENFQRACPSIEELLATAETAPLCELLSKLEVRFPPQIDDMMKKTISIAVREFSAGFCDEKFIRSVIFDKNAELFKPLLNRLIELGRIEPIDVDSFITFVTCYGFGASLLKNTSLCISQSEWAVGLSWAFKAIMPQNVNPCAQVSLPGG